MPDIYKICIDCEKEFYHNEKAQQFYTEQGFQEPKRCFFCRKKRKDQVANDKSAKAKVG